MGARGLPATRPGLESSPLPPVHSSGSAPPVPNSSCLGRDAADPEALQGPPRPPPSCPVPWPGLRSLQGHGDALRCAAPEAPCPGRVRAAHLAKVPASRLNVLGVPHIDDAVLVQDVLVPLRLVAQEDEVRCGEGAGVSTGHSMPGPWGGLCGEGQSPPPSSLQHSDCEKVGRTVAGGRGWGWGGRGSHVCCVTTAFPGLGILFEP